MMKTIGIVLQELIVGVFLHAITKEKPLNSTNQTMNMSGLNGPSSNITIEIHTRIKYNGHFSSSGFVPYRSRVTLSCKVSFQGISEGFFDMVLIGFALPNGDHVVPGNCFVDTNDLSKICKIFIKKVTMSDQGTYHCLVYYVYKGKAIKNFKETVLNVKSPPCFSSKFFCNVNKKCVDKDTECNPSRQCLRSQFRCRNGQCVQNDYVCDDIPDCADKSDETECEHIKNKCNKDFFMCNDGDCFPTDVRCNGKQDCRDNSDEINCTCPKGYFQCTSGNNCLPVSRDKRVGTRPFTKGNFCLIQRGSKLGRSTGKCVMKEHMCNGLHECQDGSDELHCGVDRSDTTLNNSNSNKEESMKGYCFIVSGMLVFTVLIILFSVWIKRKRRNLEIQYSQTVQAHEYFAWKTVTPRILRSIGEQL